MVAPLAGSVDRNQHAGIEADAPRQSLPSRGAWIEIWRSTGSTSARAVAPLAGSVDRNIDPLDVVRAGGRRSPRGERG